MQVMRHDVALALGKSGPNVDVMCTDKDFGGRFMPFGKVSCVNFSVRQTALADVKLDPTPAPDDSCKVFTLAKRLRRLYHLSLLSLLAESKA